MNHDLGKTISGNGSFMCSYTRNKRVRVNGHVLGKTRCTESRGSSDCATRNPTGAGDRGAGAATGGAHRLVPGRTRGPDSGSFYLPDRNCRSEPLAARKLQPEG